MSLLETHELRAYYGDFQALFAIDMRVEEGETVAIIGANGAGKTTLLRTVAGVLVCAPDMVMFDGRRIGALKAHQIVRLGIALVPEGRLLFPSLTIEENLLVGGYCRRPGPWTIARVFDLFPALAERRRNPAPALSGGEQQMAAIGRALMSNPRLLLCDELSLGLAPVVIRDLYQRLGAIAGEGTTLVIVEQDIDRALAASSRFYCLRQGRVALAASSRGCDRQSIIAAYFGVSGET